MMEMLDVIGNISNDLVEIDNDVSDGLTIYLTNGQFWPYQIGRS